MTELITIVGGAYSNSYVNYAEAVSIALNFPWYDDWATFSEDEITLALIQAAFAMNGLPWAGEKCNPASDAGFNYPNWSTFFQPLAAGTLSGQTRPFNLNAPGAADADTQTPIIWGTPGALMDIEVRRDIRMQPSSRTSGASLQDVDGNNITGDISGNDRIPFQGRFATITADYANLADPIGGTAWGSIYIDGRRLVQYNSPPAGATQRLAWPRKGAECDGEVTTCDYIPETIKITQVIIAYNFLKNPSDVPGTPGGGIDAPAGTYIKRQKIDVLEIEYDQFNSNQFNADCNDCDDPYLIRTYPWLKDMLGCWLDLKSSTDNRLIRLFRN